MKNKLWLFPAIFAIGACSQQAQPATHPSDTIRIALGAAPGALDPTLIYDLEGKRVLDDLFAGLVDYDNSNHPIPGLAEKWEISPDGKTYTFYLRKNLHFSDGSPLTAKDVINSYYRLAEPVNHAGYAYLLKNLTNGAEVISGKIALSALGIKAIDDKIIMTLVKPNNNWLDILTLPCFFVVKTDVIAKYGSDWLDPQHIVTSGAYMLANNVTNGIIDLRKNQYYYATNQVRIAKVEFQTMANRSSEFNSYRSGSLDITSAVPMDLTPDIRTEYKDQFKRGQNEALVYYDFNNNDPILKNNLKLRQALSMAIDREILVNKIINDEKRSPLYSTVTPTIDGGAYAMVGYDWQSLPRDEQVKLAQRLYHEAGYDSTHPLSLTITYNTDEGNKKRTLAIASMWQSVLGVKVEVANQEWKTFLETRRRANYQIARDGTNADYNSVEAYAQMYVCGSSQNNSHYCNPEYNKLIQVAENTTDKALRVKIYTQALTLALNDYPIIPLYQPTYTRLVKPYVAGYNPESNHLDRYQSKWLSLK